MNKKGFFISPVVILFFFIIGSMIAVYFNSSDSAISGGISSDSLIRKNNMQISNKEDSFASLFRLKTYYFSQISELTEELMNRLYSELNLSHIEFVNNSYPFLNVTYTLPAFYSDDGIAVSSQKNITTMINYPFLEAVGLKSLYNELNFLKYEENYTIGDWKVADISWPYVFFKNIKYNITEIYPYRIRRT